MTKPVMKSKDIGNRGEDIASVFISQQGYKIIDRNWKTRWCEIDIIATKDSAVYFVEVKYRKNDLYGSGLDYITAKKLGQMNFAAQFWLSQNNWTQQSSLAVISINGNSGEIEFIDEL